MALPPRSRIGAYEIVSFIGRGGMGEVYRARDTRLAREVAIKILPEAKASDPAWRTRFDTEARTLASLNHPHIAAIHGIEETALVHPGTVSHAIIMEFVDGETLADRLSRGPLPIAEALHIARQIAAALDAAHEKGIVHRDLKPANVKMTSGGLVKVLDFGLARSVAGTGADNPTMSVSGAIAVAGTPAYMAPEQVHGRSVDTRADVWAFGVVLYEMVTGERPFRGESAQNILAGILAADPDWSAVPAGLQPLLRACLERSPADRLRHIADYRFLLAPPATPVAQNHELPARSWRIAAGVLAGMLLALFAGHALTRTEHGRAPAALVRLSTMLPVGVSVTRGPGHTSSVALSPDGRTIVIAASDHSGRRLYRRSLDRLESVPIDGTERGTSPFFSWDGQWIGFFADGHLKRVPVDGGASVDIAEAQGFAAGASWGPDDRIVFAHGLDSYLYVVAAGGGPVDRLTGETFGRQPEVLPDGRTVLFESAQEIRAYDRHTGEIRTLLPGTAPRYANGHVIFSRGTTLLAAAIDPADGTAGAPIPLDDGVAVELPGSGGGRHYAIARSGALVYVPAPHAYELVVAGADGAERVLGPPQRSLENPRFSPDGTRIVVAARRRDEEPADLWLHDLRTETSTRLTSDGGRAPIWTDNGNAIIYSHLGEEQGIYYTRVDGGGERTRILALNAFHWLVGRPPDGSALLYGEMLPGNESAILAWDNTRSRTVVGHRSTWGGRLSRDGRWLAYYVLESGRFEVYVSPFPAGSARWLIGEGTDPSWGPDGAEIYYRSGPRLMAARLDTSAGVTVVGNRIVVDPFLPPLYDDYDIHPDGRTLVIVRPANRTQGREVTMVLDWFSEFERATQ